MNHPSHTSTSEIRCVANIGIGARRPTPFFSALSNVQQEKGCFEGYHAAISQLSGKAVRFSKGANHEFQSTFRSSK